MPPIEYFLVCRSIQTDVNTNEMSFINVLEDISPDAFPHVIPRAIAVSLWNLPQAEEPRDYQATLVVKIPGKADVAFPMNFSRGTHRCRAVQGVLEIPVDEPCDVTFEVRLNGEHAASHTVKVHPAEVRMAGGGGEHMPAAV
jgi:hypothetical protein